MTPMTNLRVVLIDDEPLVRQGLRLLLSEVNDVEIVGEATDGRSAIVLIDELVPDLAFLDVHMPELDGFAVLEALRPGPLPAVVFVTAHDEHAIRAFDHHAVDYLLKPFDGERFFLSLDRARSRLRSRPISGAPSGLETMLAEYRREQTFLERVLIKHDGVISMISVEDIDWIEAADNYVRVHTPKSRYLVRGTIKTLEQQLDPHRFVRVHRSTIVNLSRVRELHPLFGGEYRIKLSNGISVTLSRGYRDRFRALVGSLG